MLTAGIEPLRHTATGGSVVLRVERVGEDAVLEVAGTGAGIAPGELRQGVFTSSPNARAIVKVTSERTADVALGQEEPPGGEGAANGG